MLEIKLINPSINMTFGREDAYLNHKAKILDDQGLLTGQKFQPTVFFPYTELIE